VRLSRRQKAILRWWAADAKRPRGMSTSRHLELVAARPSAKGHISHSLRRLERQGLIVRTRTPGGNTERVYRTAAGRQKARTLAGREEEGETRQQNNGWCTDNPPRSSATIRAEGKRVRSKATRTTSIALGETESRVGGDTGPVSAQPGMASSGKAMLINEV
jgi:YD repeat-containing protein